jgi:hypothetical protein
MPIKKSSASTAKKKPAAERPAAKKSAARKRATKPSAALATGDRLNEVARTIGSTVGDIVAKTKRVLLREDENR